MSFLHSPCSAVFFRLAGSGLLSNSGVSGMKVTAEDSLSEGMARVCDRRSSRWQQNQRQA